MFLSCSSVKLVSCDICISMTALSGTEYSQQELLNIVEVIGMWLLILFAIVSCFLVLIYSIMRAASLADDEEERILSTMLPAASSSSAESVTSQTPTHAPERSIAR